MQRKLQLQATLPFPHVLTAEAAGGRVILGIAYSRDPKIISVATVSMVISSKSPFCTILTLFQRVNNFNTLTLSDLITPVVRTNVTAS